MLKELPKEFTSKSVIGPDTFRELRTKDDPKPKWRGNQYIKNANLEDRAKHGVMTCVVRRAGKVWNRAARDRKVEGPKGFLPLLRAVLII